MPGPMLPGMPINHRLVRIRMLLDATEGRPDGAWVIEYRGQAVLTDKGGGNPEPFRWSNQSSQVVESRARATPPLIGFDVATREDIARRLQINPALVDFVRRSDPSFPEPIATFKDGSVWDAEAIERWEPTRQALTAALPDSREPSSPGLSKPPG